MVSLKCSDKEAVLKGDESQYGVLFDMCFYLNKCHWLSSISAVAYTGQRSSALGETPTFISPELCGQ